MKKPTLNDIPNVPLSEIAMNMEYTSLLKLCTSNKKLSNFCKKDEFWKLKLKHDYPDFHNIYEFSITYREIYDSLYYKDKHVLSGFLVGKSTENMVNITVEYINNNIYDKTLEYDYKDILYDKIIQSIIIYWNRYEKTYPEDILIDADSSTYDVLYEYDEDKNIHAYSLDNEYIDDILEFESEIVASDIKIEHNPHGLTNIIVGKNKLNEPIIELVDVIISRAINSSDIGILYQFPDLELESHMTDLINLYFEYMLINNADNKYNTFFYWCMGSPRYIFRDSSSANLFFHYGYYDFLYLLADNDIYISKNYFSLYILNCNPNNVCLDDDETIIKVLNKFAKKGDLDKLKYIYYIYGLLPDKNGIQSAKNNNHFNVLSWIEDLNI